MSSKPTMAALAAALLLAGCGDAGDKGAADADTPATPVTQAASSMGKTLFLQCAACHALEADAPAKVGPNLHCVIGEPAGAREGFNYSEAFVAAASEGLTWDRESLDAFIAQPGEVVPGNAMAFGGIDDETKRSAIIDHIAESCEDGDA